MTSDLSDVLRIVDEKKQPPASAPLPPLVAPVVATGLFEVQDNPLGDMGTDDITKYIQQNQSAEDDLDLF